jgi:hypothetical protein
MAGFHFDLVDVLGEEPSGPVRVDMGGGEPTSSDPGADGVAGYVVEEGCCAGGDEDIVGGGHSLNPSLICHQQLFGS